jgi:hypothetical protein
MTEPTTTYARTATAFEALIIATPPERWSSPSPCEGWTAADVVAHVVDFSAKVLQEKGFAGPPRFADFDGQLAAFRTTREFVTRVLDAPTTPADEVQLLWASLNGDPANWEWQRANGWYRAPLAVPAEAPLQDRVLGLLGRDPYWTPAA